MITTIENDKPTLKICEMICDKELDKKLNKYELTKFLNEHSTMCFTGKPKSGKTNLLYSFFKSREIFNSTFHNVFIFQPSTSRASMKDNIFGEIPEENQFDELNLENLESIKDFVESEECKFNSCIIFDDVASQLKNKDTEKLLKQFIQNRRHMRTTCIFLNQTWYSMPKDIRKLFTNLFIFRVSKDELKTIFSEMVENKEKFINEISGFVYNKPFKYLFINVDSQRLFDGFDELIIK